MFEVTVDPATGVEFVKAGSMKRLMRPPSRRATQFRRSGAPEDGSDRVRYPCGKCGGDPWEWQRERLHARLRERMRGGVDVLYAAEV